jgi:Zn finger protein HypA/HybF involved in hydrogenase expression
MEYGKQFHCKECSHTFEKVVLEAVVSAVCPNAGSGSAFLSSPKNKD